MNAQDPWHFHDLNDVLFLGTAAGYADVVLVEKKTCSYLRRVEGRVPPGARVHRRAVEALPDIVAAVGASTRLT